MSRNKRGSVGGKWGNSNNLKSSGGSVRRIREREKRGVRSGWNFRQSGEQGTTSSGEPGRCVTPKHARFVSTNNIGKKVSRERSRAKLEEGRWMNLRRVLGEGVSAKRKFGESGHRAQGGEVVARLKRGHRAVFSGKEANEGNRLGGKKEIQPRKSQQRA